MLRASTKTKTEAMEELVCEGSRNQAYSPGLDGGRDDEEKGVKDIPKFLGLGDYGCWSLDSGTCQA